MTSQTPQAQLNIITDGQAIDTLPGTQIKYRFVVPIDGLDTHFGPYDTYDRAVAQADLFKGLLGQRPSVQVILTCSSVQAVLKHCKDTARTVSDRVADLSTQAPPAQIVDRAIDGSLPGTPSDLLDRINNLTGSADAPKADAPADSQSAPQDDSTKTDTKARAPRRAARKVNPTA